MKIFPVVHIGGGEKGLSQAVTQSELAFEHDADGVYLIRHAAGETAVAELFRAYAAVRQATPQESYVGINILQARSPREAVAMTKQEVVGIAAPSGLWVDDITWHGHDADMLAHVRKTPRLDGMRTLGGVAFKYTDSYTEDPAEAATQAYMYNNFADVLVTSGPETGRSADPQKTRAMKRQLATGESGEGLLALASGIDIDNIADFEGSVDEVLVASSVETEKGSGIFDEAKLRDLIQAAHKLA
ncbi:hypothetical protein GII36_01495 [Candidatus Mycosynbacter amalyticus]|uniref:Phosphoribosylanthranilate isomerase n=1 Tax=Candidatus Mycosynbacter amalyticus TaxID=2665156 RepID=A0A857MMZ2_9BACT|nr:BtpA/SgcQ family protein [Candidatus Mycosynbacter amalyticus]QHN42521.1 hypothetical protein GII36_01495 [Candidatus Mycosynbacter amalyticus]